MADPGGILDDDCSFCDLCEEFVSDLTSWCISHPRTSFPPGNRWTGSGGLSFDHYDNTKSFLTSSETCSLCRFILLGFPLPIRLSDDWALVLQPMYNRGSWSSPDGIRAIFRHPDEMHPSGFHHLFRISQRVPYSHPVSDGDYYFERDIPDSAMSQDAFDTIRYWTKNCAEKHADCRRPPSLTLPTRVVDVGASEGDKPVLYVTKGEQGRYIALSHCWGEQVPMKTLTANLEAYQGELPVAGLPRNFLDAIRTTRELGIRYLWIDALCIVQDDPEDWAREATRMAAVYSNAALTLSALDSERPDCGFLVERRHKSIKVSPDAAFHRPRRRFCDGIENCVLNKRGWCMQERLLSPAVVHFGQDQMYWECCTNTSEERLGNSGSNCSASWSFVSWNDETVKFTGDRKRIRGQGPMSLRDWELLVSEYSHRKLTYRSDKLSALAGAASLFKSAGIGGAYIAGMFMDNLANELFWSARTIRVSSRKAPGYDSAEELIRPADGRYPSWSWASVDGAVEFHGSQLPPPPKTTQELKWEAEMNDEYPTVDNINNVEPFPEPEKPPPPGPQREKPSFEIVDVKVDVGFDDIMAERVVATLKLRAHIGRVRYEPSNTPSLAGTQDIGSARPIGGQAITDVDRREGRDCWALITALMSPGVLLLDEVKPDVFRRIGWVELHNEVPEDFHYSEREFELI